MVKVFYEVLKMFDNQPINIFQVGAIESFDSSFRFGSGWSDIFFANYIKKHGGELTICDPELDHLANSIASASLLDYNINSIFGRAEDFTASSSSARGLSEKTTVVSTPSSSKGW